MTSLLVSAAALALVARTPCVQQRGTQLALPVRAICLCAPQWADEISAEQAEDLTEEDQALMAMSDDELIALADAADTVELEEPAPPPYQGPTPAPGETLRGVVCSIELPEVGLVLEVAESLASGGDGQAGLGLFVRLAEGVESVTLNEGVAMCGYAHGQMMASPDELGGKTVGFWLKTALTSFFFERELHTVASRLATGADVEAIAGHTIVRDAHTGEVQAIEADPEWAGARFFVPHTEQGALSIMNIGQFSNDLAMPGASVNAADGYGTDSSERNLVSFRRRFEPCPGARP